MKWYVTTKLKWNAYKVLLLGVLFLISAHALAQRTITGTVRDENQQALLGVNIVVQNTLLGTTTDDNGRYTLTLNTDGSNDTLVFSYVGYNEKKVAVAGQSELNVNLTEGSTLDEVIVVGYGTVKKSDLTGSVASVKAEEINAFPAANPLQALSGRAPGVQVLQNNGAPGGGVSVRIRGTNSIQGSNEPLYVIDGFPISGSNPTILNNADIESVEILKDASATAIYGSRGANGVVIITTKRGKAGKTNVDYEGSYSIQQVRNKLDLMNPRQYGEFYNEQAANDGLAPYFSAAQLEQFSTLGAGTDWQDVVLQDAPLHNHSLNISGGSEKTQFAVGGAIYQQDGIIINSYYNRYSLRANVNHAVSSKFDVSLSANLSRINTNRKNTNIGNRGSGLITAMLAAPPTLSPYNDDGSYRVLATSYPFISNVLVNPLNFLYELSDVVEANRMLANASVTYKPFKGLSIRISGGIENADDRTDEYTTRRFVNSTGAANINTLRNTNLLNENVITYTTSFNKRHQLTVVGGFTYQDFLTTSLAASGTGFVSDVSETYDLGAAALFNTPGSSYSKATLLSYLGRINYTFNDRYLFTASFRADGSSRYSIGDKWGYFPSGAVAWRVSEEPFLKNSATISNLKLRASFGSTGSQAINPYATLNSLRSGKTVFDDALFTTYSPGTRLPANLRWETTYQTDFGVDLSLWNYRLNLTADYYIKNTLDLLNTVQLPASLGYTNTIQNVGEIENRGLELGLDANIFDGNFKWNVAANIAFNRNKVLKLYNGQDIFGTAFFVGPLNDFINLLREGQPLGVFYGYLENGYNDKGNLTYKDLNGDGAINTRDKTFIGDPNPDFIYGFNTTLSFKGFELGVFVQGSQGNDIFNLSANQSIDLNFGMNQLQAQYLDHWTKANPNPNAQYPAITRTLSGNISNRFVEDGSYLRLRNIQLAYNVPLSQMGVKWFRNLQVYASGQNLLTITDYSWFDPEINTYGGANSIVQGIDHFSYPTAKTVTFGIRAGF
jgi:TonB-linked SusC/RagA family outer membrane protein